ncbi:MAG: hypothetical protein JW931_04385 [Methanomicrobiaceae archaeon]|nr:hypothetical protein [Methanomicrobiaceae archaeon]
MVLGAVAVAFGCADILVWAGFSSGLNLGIIEIAGDDFFRWAWGGLVVLMGGLIMLSGAVDAGEIRQFAKVTLGALMLLMIAGTDIFARLCENIPAGEEAPEFFNSLGGFIGGFAPPYSPAILLLPFVLVIVYLAVKYDGEN